MESASRPYEGSPDYQMLLMIDLPATQDLEMTTYNFEFYLGMFTVVIG